MQPPAALMVLAICLASPQAMAARTRPRLRPGENVYLAAPFVCPTEAALAKAVSAIAQMDFDAPVLRPGMDEEATKVAEEFVALEMHFALNAAGCSENDSRIQIATIITVSKQSWKIWGKAARIRKAGRDMWVPSSALVPVK